MATYPAYAAAPAQYAPVHAAAPATDPYQQAAYAHPPPTAYAPAPQYASYAPAYAANPDEVRTVFITGFPIDVKERELNNLLRFLPGYEVRWKPGWLQTCFLIARLCLHIQRRLHAGITDALEGWPGKPHSAFLQFL